MHVVEAFRRAHARGHSARVSEGLGGLSLEDQVLEGMAESQMRLRPHGLNSVAWLLWHMTRTEDAVIGLVLTGRGQVLDEANWPAALNVAQRDIGTGMTGSEVDDLTARIDLAALRAYRLAVGLRTRCLVEQLRPEAVGEPISLAHLRLSVASGAFGDNAGWLLERWQSKLNEWLLFFSVVGHNDGHLGQIGVIRKLMGLPPVQG